MRSARMVAKAELTTVLPIAVKFSGLANRFAKFVSVN